MNHHQVHCERCGDELVGSYATTAYSATGLTMQTAPDGAGAAFGLGGFVACSWNCLAVLAAQRAGSTADAAVRVVAERERQIRTEGWSPEHDASHPEGQLALAAICYAGQHADLGEAFIETDQDIGTAQGEGPPYRWPWGPRSKERDLVRAGALLAAELDRDPSRRRDVSSEQF